MDIALNGDLSWEYFELIADGIRSLEKEEYINIYIFSNGGSISVSMAILHLINKNRDKVHLYGGSLNSAGFDLFFKAKCSRTLLPFVDGMYHQTKIIIEINEDGRPTYFIGEHNKKWIQSFHAETLRVANTLGFTPAEIKKLKKGDELYFMEDRLKDFLIRSKKL